MLIHPYWLSKHISVEESKQVVSNKIAVWSGTILLANAFPVLRNLVLALKELSVDVG